MVGIPTLGQDFLDPQGEITTAECYGHHKQEGFRSMDLFPALVDEVPKGAPFEFRLIVKNPWLADLQDVRAYVNISDAPGLEFPGAQAPDAKPLPNQPTEPTGAGYKAVSYPVTVGPGATEVWFSATGKRTTPLGALTPGRVSNQSDYHVAILAPDGTLVGGRPPPGGDQAQYTPDAGTHHLEAFARVETAALVAHGPGAYVAKVYYGGLDASPYDAYQATYYNASQNTELLLQGPKMLGPGESHTFRFQVIAKDVESLQRMRYGGRAVSYHDHHDGGQTENAGTYDKYSTMEFRTGATLSLGNAVDASGTAVSLLEPTLRRWGQVLGLAGSFLIIPSLVFGGTFGRGSVAVLNKWFGGPRRRVLFHNSMSFWLLAVASLHMLLFFYEAFWVWSAGLVWGGLALASMMGLGVTGATQRSFVARWGFNRWRFVHFAMGILVVVFTLVHMVADGSHFAPIRAMFGDVVQR
jgi:hypothetical protein